MSDNVAIEKFLKSAEQFIDVDAVSGAPIITYTKEEVYVKIKESVVKRSDDLAACVLLFDKVGGDWQGSINRRFVIKRVLPSAPACDVLWDDVPVSDLVAGAQPRLSRNEETKQKIIGNVRDRLARGLNPFTDRFKTRPSKQFLGKHEVVDGYGRWGIALALMIASVPLIEREMSDSEAWEVAYIANDRDDLSDFERGKCFSDMLRLFPEVYSTQRVLGKKLGENEKRISQLIGTYEQILREKPNLPEGISNQLEKSGSGSKLMEALRAPEEVKSKVVSEMVTADLTREETKELVHAIKEKVDLGISPVEAFDEVKKERVSTEEALANSQADVELALKAEDAKVAKLSKFYPSEMVAAAVKQAGWLGESKTVEVLEKGVAVMWSRLTPEEQNVLFTEAP